MQQCTHSVCISVNKNIFGYNRVRDVGVRVLVFAVHGNSKTPKSIQCGFRMWVCAPFSVPNLLFVHKTLEYFTCDCFKMRMYAYTTFGAGEQVLA